jgi:hypothetical protein
MRLALGLTVHTGWAACVLAGGSLRDPHVEVREHLALVADDAARFVFHRAAEMKRTEAAPFVALARREAVDRAAAVFRRLAEGRDVRACAIVAKPGAMPELDAVLASHPRIHTAEGIFYRDVITDAARAAGVRSHVVAPSGLDAKDRRLAEVGRAVGKPWNQDWKLAALAAWQVLA